MGETEHEKDAPGKDIPFARLSADQLPTGGGGASLRGPAVASIGRRFWLVVGVIALLTFAVAIVVSFLSASNDNARIERLKDHGIPVAIRVTNCYGNIGGSGSNGAGYTCHGRYRVDGVSFEETIGAMSVFSSSGTLVRGVADPLQHSSVVLASAVRRSVASASAYLDPGLLAVVLLALTWALRYYSRRAGPSGHPRSPS
jgi:hypothetical protein